ncbi:uncharacterized protein MKK02DRAFT_38169 [Dioszegia hungarica]|uniref:Uncharacterized protein n=1 Tax=Dioszegia hungarica TaxID=4972 RepID=A0AA38H4D9_9TREE|nr:uncharacterized protein MKK02DRAFT_38169 [Dioszegia hungarica]KAI9633515.1 hypothetical protein MKK02DRAFT_38169 [Dioszegia hungarica]
MRSYLIALLLAGIASITSASPIFAGCSVGTTTNIVAPFVATSDLDCQVTRLVGSYVYRGCSSALLTAYIGLITTTEINVETCFNACGAKGLPFAAMLRWTGNPSTYCRCFSGFTGTFNTGSCVSSSQFIFYRTPGATVSGNYRRRAVGQGPLAIARVCPSGFEACLAAAGSDGYECVDTATELESCGGCDNGLNLVAWGGAQGCRVQWRSVRGVCV